MFMKILFLNERDLGKTEKRKMVKRLVKDRKADMILLQVTIWSASNHKSYKTIWVGGDAKWVMSETVGYSGGLIGIWDKNILGPKLLRITSVRLHTGYWQLKTSVYLILSDAWLLVNPSCKTITISLLSP